VGKKPLQERDTIPARDSQNAASFEHCVTSPGHAGDHLSSTRVEHKSRSSQVRSDRRPGKSWLPVQPHLAEFAKALSVRGLVRINLAMGRNYRDLWLRAAVPWLR
jgi:hypothetical protein